jgi:hypothetical protein
MSFASDRELALVSMNSFLVLSAFESPGTLAWTGDVPGYALVTAIAPKGASIRTRNLLRSWKLEHRIRRSVAPLCFVRIVEVEFLVCVHETTGGRPDP